MSRRGGFLRALQRSPGRRGLLTQCSCVQASFSATGACAAQHDVVLAGRRSPTRRTGARSPARAPSSSNASTRPQREQIEWWWCSPAGQRGLEGGDAVDVDAVDEAEARPACRARGRRWPGPRGGRRRCSAAWICCALRQQSCRASRSMTSPRAPPARWPSWRAALACVLEPVLVTHGILSRECDGSHHLLQCAPASLAPARSPPPLVLALAALRRRRRRRSGRLPVVATTTQVADLVAQRGRRPDDVDAPAAPRRRPARLRAAAQRRGGDRRGRLVVRSGGDLDEWLGDV